MEDRTTAGRLTKVKLQMAVLKMWLSLSAQSAEASYSLQPVFPLFGCAYVWIDIVIFAHQMHSYPAPLCSVHPSQQHNDLLVNHASKSNILQTFSVNAQVTLHCWVYGTLCRWNMEDCFIWCQGTDSEDTYLINLSIFWFKKNRMCLNAVTLK